MLCSACRTLSTEFHIVSIDGHVVARDFSLKLLVRCCGRSGRPCRDLGRDISTDIPCRGAGGVDCSRQVGSEVAS